MSMVGSGTGLPVVKSIVDAMGGSIELTSRKGNGTTVIVRLKLEERGGMSDTGKEELSGEEDLDGRHVLVCEDNDLNLEIIRQILEMQGMQVTTAENGKEGVEIFSRSQPGYYDAILMDIRMPHVDGLEATRRIRALARTDAGKIPIIALTADAFSEDVESVLAAGMNEHLAKPVDMAYLFQVLARLTGR